MTVSQTLQIAYAIDGRGTEPCALSIYSALKRTARKTAVHVLYANMQPADIRMLKDTVGLFRHATLHLHAVADTAVGKINLTHTYLTNMTFARFLLPDLLTGRVVYLDYDTLVRADVGALADLDLGSNVAAGVRDFGFVDIAQRAAWAGTWHKPGDDVHREKARRRIAEVNAILGQPLHATYFNAGVLVLDCDRIAADATLIAAFRDFAPALGLPYLDQDWLNITLRGKVRLIDPKWNSFWGNQKSSSRRFTNGLRRAYAASRYNPAIVHFTDRHKPWLPYNAVKHKHKRFWFWHYRLARWEFRRRLVAASRVTRQRQPQTSDYKTRP